MTTFEIAKARQAEAEGNVNTALWILRASIKSPSGSHIDKVHIVGSSLIDMIMDLKDYGEENILEAHLTKDVDNAA
jgi:hypothetical protein